MWGWLSKKCSTTKWRSGVSRCGGHMQVTCRSHAVHTYIVLCLCYKMAGKIYRNAENEVVAVSAYKSYHSLLALLSVYTEN